MLRKRFSFCNCEFSLCLGNESVSVIMDSLVKVYIRTRPGPGQEGWRRGLEKTCATVAQALSSSFRAVSQGEAKHLLLF